MKRVIKLLFLIVPLLSSGNLPAQKQGQLRLDSMLQQLPQQKEDTNKVNLLKAISFTYKDMNADEGIKYGQMGLALATKLQWNREIAGANNAIGINYVSKSDYTKALIYYNEAFKIYKEMDFKPGLGAVTGNIATVYNAQGYYARALEYFLQAQKMFEESGKKSNVASTIGNIGILYSNLGDYAKALEYYLKALKLHEELKDKYDVATITGNIGGVYLRQNNYPKALEYFFNALKFHEEIGNKSAAIAVIGNIGNVYRHQHNYTQAVAWIYKAMQMAKELGDKNAEAYNLTDLGLIYMSIAIGHGVQNGTSQILAMPETGTMPYNPDSLIPKGRTALLRKAVECINKAIAMNKEIGSLHRLVSGYLNLSRADSALGDYTSAYYAYIQYSIFKDSVFSKDNALKMAKLELMKKIEADSLKNEQARSVTELKYREQRNYTRIGLGAVALLLTFAFFMFRNNKLLNKEKQRSESLLLNILPGEVAFELKDKGVATAKHFDNVTVLFTDFVNFTKAGEQMSPQELVDELHICFKAFDEITGKYNIEKIKTVGDAYLAAAGLPVGDPKHAEHVVMAAAEINRFMQDRNAKLGDKTFQIRIGVHSGSVVAGIVGMKKFAYDIWGDTVNTAARMEQNCEAGKINISHTTYALVKDKFACEYRGEVDAKGKGMLKMYYVDRDSDSFSGLN